MDRTRPLRIYLLRVAQNVQAQAEYRLDFVIGNLATVLRQAVGLAFVWVIFERVGSLGSWTLAEVMVIYGLAGVPLGLFELLFNGLWRINGMIRLGELDRFLHRPGGPLLYVMTTDSALHGVGDLVTGLIIFAVGAAQVGLSWSLGSVLFTVGAIVCGTVLHFSINLISASVSFWVVGLRSSLMYGVHSLSEFTKYPLTIYANPIQLLLTWVVPFGFAGFYPAAILLDRPETTWIATLLPLVTGAFFAVSLLIWRAGLRTYESTGS